MTISSEAPRRHDYLGNGTQTVFPYTFKIFAASDLAIYDETILLTLNTHYTVSGAGSDIGGNVTLTAALGTGRRLTILSAVPALQETDFQEGTRFPASVVEALADRLVALYQQGRTDDRRALRLALLSTFADLTVPDPVADYLLAWNTGLTGLRNVNPSTVLPGAAALPLSLVNGGTEATTALGARVSLGVDGQVRKVLTNRTGGGLVLGDVVALDTANDSAVALDDTVSSKAQRAIAVATIADSITGEFLLAGVGTVNVTGAVIRGRYLRKATATKVAEDSGVLQGPASDIPQGAFAVALTSTGGPGAVTAYVFGFTHPGTTAPVITGLSRVIGLVAGNTGGTSTTQVDVTATTAVVRNPFNGETLVLPTVASRTVDITVAGPVAGGRDQAIAFPANSWLHLYLIAKTDNTYHVTVSLAAPAAGPTLPTGYTLAAYAGALRLNNSSALALTYLRGAWASYAAQQNALTDGAATVETAIGLNSFVPPNALMTVARIRLRSFNGNGAFLRVSSGQTFWSTPDVGDATYAIQLTFPNVAQNLFYNFQSAPLATLGLYVDVEGYENPI